MNCIKFLLSVIVALSSMMFVHGQSYEEEIGFTFVKAKYLLDTDRYDDAVREFNRVINENPSLENALALRALAKYKLSAYIGTKKDILKYIELKGVTPEAVALLAKAEYQLTEFDAALNSLSTAIILITDDPELYEFRASIYMDRDEQIKACSDWEAAVLLGSSKALMAAKTNCGYREISEAPAKTEEEVLTAEENTSPDLIRKSEDHGTFNEGDARQNETVTDPVLSSGNEENIIEHDVMNNPIDSGMIVQTAGMDSLILTQPAPPPEPEIDPRLLDDSVNEIVIDEDLTLHLTGQGIGSRKVVRQPNILILSDEDGVVVIDICVSRGGRVVNATFNEAESTLLRKSLVSLAIRKAKDFWFDKSDLIEQCGALKFKIKGS